MTPFACDTCSMRPGRPYPSHTGEAARTSTDRQLVLSLVKEVEIIGEAAYQLSRETRASMPEAPWEDIIGMRHRLVHTYFDINLDILWQTIEQDLPALIPVLEAMVPPEEF